MFAYFDALLTAMRAYPTLLQVSGVIGSVIYVGGFAFVQSGKTCGNGALYSASKIVAAFLVLVSLVGAFNLGAFLVQIGFIGFGLLGLFRQMKLRRVAIPPNANAPSAPASQESLQATSDWRIRPPARVRGKPVPPCPAAAALTL